MSRQQQVQSFRNAWSRLWLLLICVVALLGIKVLDGWRLQVKSSHDLSLDSVARTLDVQRPAGRVLKQEIAGLGEDERKRKFSSLDEAYDDLELRIAIGKPAAAAVTSDVEGFAGAMSERTRLVAKLRTTSMALAVEESNLLAKLEKPLANEDDEKELKERAGQRSQLKELYDQRRYADHILKSRIVAMDVLIASARAQLRAEFERAASSGSRESLLPRASTPIRNLVLSIVDRNSPLYVVYEVLWYTFLIVAVLALASFIFGLLQLFAIKGVESAFEDRVLEVVKRAPGEAAAAGAKKIAAVAFSVGLAAVAATPVVLNADSSPWHDRESVTDGLAGKDGRIGKDGKNATDGRDGRNGIDGKDGIGGRNGIDGLMGVQGNKGDKGNPGDKGFDGRNAMDGIRGVDGRDGIDGEDGRDGFDGEDGRDGFDGKDGKDGTDGESLPVEDIWSGPIRELQVANARLARDLETANTLIDELQVKNGLLVAADIEIQGKITTLNDSMKTTRAVDESLIHQQSAWDVRGLWAALPPLRQYQFQRILRQSVEDAYGKDDPFSKAIARAQEEFKDPMSRADFETHLREKYFEAGAVLPMPNHLMNFALRAARVPR